MNRTKTAPAWAKQIEASLNASIADARDTIIDAVGKHPGKGGRPAARPAVSRGPKNTTLMKRQLAAFRIYIEVELHKTLGEATSGDAFNLWRRDENREFWNKAAKRKDAKRGYSNFNTLFNAFKASLRK